MSIMASTLSNHQKMQLGHEVLEAELVARGCTLMPAANRRRPSERVLVGASGLKRLIAIRISFRGDWQLKLNDFLDLQYDAATGVQRVRGILDVPDAPELYSFVRMKRPGQSRHRFFIVPRADLQRQIALNHEAYMVKHHGRRPKTPASMHTAVRMPDVERYEGNWGVLT